MSLIYTIGGKPEAIIAYSVPGSSEFILATIKLAETIEEVTSFTSYDFVVAPFDKSKHSQIGIKIANYATSKKFECFPKGKLNQKDSTKETYGHFFDRAKALISETQLRKVIISRVKNIKDEVGDLYPLFLRMKNKYVSAYTFLIHIPAWGTWMGSTPELVLQSESDGFYSRAIAGTRPSSSNNLPWGQKEIEEHKFIEQYLTQSLEAAELKYEISPTFDLKAGPVTHICSDIKIIATQHHLDRILNIIHPGPALSGMPRDKSIKEISNIESHDRRYYCGYIGSIDSKEISLYATIRCMEVFEDGYSIYVGGGITSSSELESEWEETNMKSETLASLLYNAEIVE